MALTNHRFLSNIPTTLLPLPRHPLLRSFIIPATPSSQHFRTTTIVSASKKSGSSRTGRFDSKNRRTSVPTKDEEEEEMGRIETRSFDAAGFAEGVSADGTPMPELPGKEQDFWEGQQWEPLGFFIQYMWAFGILFALGSGGIAVATYNEGAADFKDTPVYKEAIQSRDLLEEPEGSNAEVFESNPTEQAPNVE